MISIFETKGISVNWGLLFVLAILFFERRQNKILSPSDENIKINFSIKNITILLLFIIATFSWEAISIFSGGNFAGAEIEKDGVFYGEISRCLIENGNENTFGAANFIGNDFHFQTPYHYFELWLNGIVSFITGINPIHTLYLVIYPFFMILLLSGGQGSLKIISLQYAMNCFLI